MKKLWSKLEIVSTHWAWFMSGLALLLRLPLLSGSFWLDEAAQALESARPLSQQFAIIPDFQPPLFHLLIHLTLLLSASEWWPRFVGSVLPGVATVGLTYLIGKKVFSHQVGVIASLLLATSSFHIFYSQELRQYSLPAFFLTLGWWLVVQSHTKTWRWWLQWSLVAVAGIYTSYLFPFGLAFQCCYLWFKHPQSRLKLFLWCLIVAASFLPWLPLFRLQLAAGGEVQRSLPGWSSVVGIPQLKSLPLVLAKFLFGVQDVSLRPYFLLVTGLLFGWVFTLFSRTSTRKLVFRHRGIGLLLMWFVLPVVAAWLFSFLIPVLQPKRVLFTLPACYLALAWLVELTKKKWQLILVGLLATIQVVSTSAYYTNSNLQRENWREVHNWVSSRYSATNSLAIFVFPEPFAPWRWYDDGSYPTLATGSLSIDEVTDISETLKPALESRYLITFDYLMDLSDPERKLLSRLKQLGYDEIDSESWPGVGFVRVWSKPENTVSFIEG